MQKLYKLFVLSLVIFTSAQTMAATDELGTDPRIKTLIYGKNDVFKLISIYGYQTVVEFEEDEKIVTISVGNPNIFKLIPSGNRLFLKALQNNQLTNMTLITTKRSYQFELASSVETGEDMMYVVRFFYPDDGSDNSEIKTESVISSQPMNIYSSISLPNNAPANPAPVFNAPAIGDGPMSSSMIPTSDAININTSTPLMGNSDLSIDSQIPRSIQYKSTTTN